MPPARICVVSPEFIGPFPNGGVGTACYWEAFTLGAAGYDVTVLYTGPTQRETPEYWEAHFARTAPFRFVDVAGRVPAGEVERLARYDHSCFEARASELVLAWLRGERFDLVLFQEFLGHGARSLQARRSGDALARTRTVTTLHSSRQWIYEGMHRFPGSPQDLAVDFLEKESARLADRTIAPSRHMAEWAVSHWRLADRPMVLPYCYDDTQAQPRSVVEHAGPFRHLVFFGRLETRKGLHLFCRALADRPELRDHVERVTFLGKPSRVEGMPSETYIAAQMAKVPGLAWAIEDALGSFEAQSWLASRTGVLVVAPSVVDNLPYAVIELQTRRIPFVSTNVGGIPEIVGDANNHLLAEPNDASLAALIGRVCREGRLAVDYRSGYDVGAANAAHMDFVRSLLAEPPVEAAAPVRAAFDVVVTNAADDRELARVRTRAGASDREMLAGRWTHFDQWRRHESTAPVLFIDARVTPEAGCASRLLTALGQPGVDAATSYFIRQDGSDTPPVAAPLGASLESGWRRNAFGGPCLAANPSAFTALTTATVHQAFAFWPAYAAVACSGMTLAMVPAPLYAASTDALEVGSHAEIGSMLHQFHARVPANLDLGWLLKSVFDGPMPGTSAGRALYDRLAAIPDEMLRAYAGLAPDAAGDALIHDFAAVRERLAAVVARWRRTEPRVFVYGTGSHTRMLLMICPELGPFVAGFIDRRPTSRFLGKPCVTPDEFHPGLADAIVYSSREFEHDMYAGMRDAPVEHVLLYRESPPAPEDSTATRLRNRFGHRGADLAALRHMYRPPAWATGYVSASDADFLAEMVAAHQPRTVVELGVASGASSAVLLHALDRLPDPGVRTLYSCDITSTCYFDDAYATGQACREMYPAPVTRWHRESAMAARRLRSVLPAASVDLTFIDANHAHPWPLLDLLHATAFAQPGSWVILHDIDLPIQHPEYQVYGPRWLFQAWPFNKIKGVGTWTSIGAVQLPPDPSALVPLALSLIDKPWEQAPPPWHTVLPPAFAPVQARLERIGAAASVLVTK
jgi:glycosyltransferase involved in cell wall biosynthesis/predicted O-methyltransferase YrrM